MSLNVGCSDVLCKDVKRKCCHKAVIEASRCETIWKVGVEEESVVLLDRLQEQPPSCTFPWKVLFWILTRALLQQSIHRRGDIPKVM